MSLCRLLVFPLVFIILHFVPATILLYSQEPDEILISVSYQDVPLKDVIVDLETKYSLKFSYVDQLINRVTITAQINNMNLDDALNIIFVKTDISFKLMRQRQIVLYKDEFKKKDIDRHGTIIGIIIDEKSSEALSYVNVIIDSSSWGTYSNSKGQFSLKQIPFGTYYLRVMDISHEYSLIPLNVNGQVVDLDTIRLEPKIYEGENIVITGEKNSLVINDEKLRLQPSIIVLKRKEINSKPGLLEPDLFRALQTLPGVTATNDLSNELYVRGGTPDQNLITLDRAVVYQPYHLFGIAGIFNTDIIDQVNFSSGGFSSQYGNRLSSVIDVRTKSTTAGNLHGTGTASLLSSKLTLDGQMNNQWYYMISGRRTYLDQISNVAKSAGLAPETLPYHFYDGMGKIVFQPNMQNQFGLIGFISEDNFKRKTTDWRYDYAYYPNYQEKKLHYASVTTDKFLWNNGVINFYWEFNNQSNWVSRMTLYQSRAGNDLSFRDYYKYSKAASDSIKRLVDSVNGFPDPNPVKINNYILDRTIRWDNEYEINNDHKLLLGAEFSRIQLHYYWDNMGDAIRSNKFFQVFFDAPPDSFNYSRSLDNYAFYLEDLWRFGERWTFKPGVRLEKFAQSRPRWAASPRFSTRYDYNKDLALKAAAGLYYQSLFTSREKSYIGFLEIPFSTSGMKLQKSVHYIFGAEYFLRGDSKITGEMYYKTFLRLSKNYDATENSPIFIQGHGRAYGMEFTWKKLGKKFSYETDYSLSVVTRKFNKQSSYYTNYDQRHVFSFMGNYQLPKNWMFDFRWVLASGRAYRPASFYSSYINFDPLSGNVTSDYSEYESINADNFEHLNYYGRFPVYHRLDISFVKTIRFESWVLKPYINIINIYNKWNPMFYEETGAGKTFITNEPDPQTYSVQKRKPYGMPILPSFGAHFEF